MTTSLKDFSVLKKFDFSYVPIAMKFLLNKPEGIEKLAASFSICQMFREAQDMPPFYASEENFSCVDRLLLGFTEPEPIF